MSITHIAGIFPLLVRLLALRQVVVDRAPNSSLPLPGADLWLHVRDRRTHVPSLSRAWLGGATVYRSVSTGRQRMLTTLRTFAPPLASLVDALGRGRVLRLLLNQAKDDRA